MTVPEDPTLTNYRGSVLFEQNRATGTSEGFCGLGCGGAVYVGESSTADLDRVDFSSNSAADGGAVFVDLLGELSLSRGTMSHNAASGNGGAMSVGTIARISATQIVARDNVADGSGGLLYLSGAMAAVLQGIDATNNTARASGGAVAVFDSSRTVITLTNATIRQNSADGNGGGIFSKDSTMDVVGVQVLENSVQNNGGGIATSGPNAVVLSDSECVNVEVLLDWTRVGDGCVEFGPTGTSCDGFVLYWAMSCAQVESVWDSANACNGCPCNDEYVWSHSRQISFVK